MNHDADLQSRPAAMLRLILQDDSMPRTVFWARFLEALKQSGAHDIMVPAEDIACETNWPVYGNPAAAYIRGPAHDFETGKNVDRYLDRIVGFARENPEQCFLVVNMEAFFRFPLILRNIKNIYIADGNLVEFERALNPRTISLPALPITAGIPPDLESRDILASFQGFASHPVRHALASIADGKKIIVNLVEQSNHVGKINALTKTVETLYERLLKRSIFAFVPRGDANYSYRLLEVMSFGCIPVILSDGWVLPFDRVLQWDAFSLRFSADAISLIPDLLGSLSEDEISVRFREVQKVYAAHFKDWDCIVETLFSELEALRRIQP